MDVVGRLLDEFEDPLKLDEWLVELADELQAEYLDHEVAAVFVDAVERTSPPSDEREGELIEEAE